MIGIEAVASYFPAASVDNLRRAEQFGLDPSFITKKIGAETLRRKEEGEETSDLAVLAVQRLVENTALKLSSIDAIVLITQNPDGQGLPHTAAIVHRKLGLSNGVAAFDVSLGCSGYVYGLSILRGLMEQAGLKNGLLVTADPYSKIIDRTDRDTSLLFGDAATATWLCEAGPWKFGKPLLETDGTGAHALYASEGRLHMKGREVFNFAAVEVPKQIKRCLLEKKLEPSAIDLFCLHQGSHAIIDAISRRFAAVSERFVVDLRDCGNTVSSTIPILLERHVLQTSLNRVLVCGFGVGLSWATNVIEKENR